MNPSVQRLVVMLTTLVVGLVGLLVVGAAPASATSSDLFSLLNQSRAGAGLKGLSRDARLDKVAQDWTDAMASSRTMAHNPRTGDQIPSGWTSWGENIGYAGTDAALQAAWMNSAPHKANILSTRFNSVGVGWARDGDGHVWGTQVFGTYSGVALVPVGGTPVASTVLASRSGTGSAQIRQVYSYGLGPVEDLGGVIIGDPEVVNRSGKLEVYVRGTDGRIFVRVGVPGAWAAWRAISSTPATARPDVVVSGSVVDIFIRDTAGQVSSMRSPAAGSYRSWVPVGGRLAPGSGPSVTRLPSGAVHLTVVGTDGAVWTQALGSRWVSLGGTVVAEPSVVTTSSGQTYVLARSTDGRVWQRGLAPAQGWTGLGGLTRTSPRAVLDPSGRPVVAVLGTNGSWYLHGVAPAFGWLKAS